MIEHIQIQNFKSIRQVSVELSGVTVLIGRSGVGKSNFLRAIRFLRNFLNHGNRALEFEGGWRYVFPFGEPAELFFSIRFSIPEYDKKFSYELAWKLYPQSPRDPSLVVERLRVGSELVFGRSESQWEAWPDARPKAPLQAHPYLGLFPTITECVLAFTFLTSGIGWHDFPAGVFQGNGQNLDTHGQGLNDLATNYLGVLRDLTQNLQSQHARRQILARSQQINPSISSLELDSILKPGKVVVGHKVSKQLIPLDLSQESDGFRRYYAHLLALYQTPPKQVLMFEEPENSIYPGALANLAEEFESAAVQGRGQVLLTTQSPDLLDGFEPEMIRVVDADQAGSTHIGRLDPTQVQAVRDRLLEPGELMTVDRARLADTSV
jgi:predicted ATPase